MPWPKELNTPFIMPAMFIAGDFLYGIPLQNSSIHHRRTSGVPPEWIASQLGVVTNTVAHHTTPLAAPRGGLEDAERAWAAEDDYGRKAVVRWFLVGYPMILDARHGVFSHEMRSDFEAQNPQNQRPPWGFGNSRNVWPQKQVGYCNSWELPMFFFQIFYISKACFFGWWLSFVQLVYIKVGAYTKLAKKHIIFDRRYIFIYGCFFWLGNERHWANYSTTSPRRLVRIAITQNGGEGDHGTPPKIPEKKSGLRIILVGICPESCGQGVCTLPQTGVWRWFSL